MHPVPTDAKASTPDAADDHIGQLIDTIDAMVTVRMAVAGANLEPEILRRLEIWLDSRKVASRAYRRINAMGIARDVARQPGIYRHCVGRNDEILDYWGPNGLPPAGLRFLRGLGPVPRGVRPRGHAMTRYTFEDADMVDLVLDAVDDDDGDDAIVYGADRRRKRLGEFTPDDWHWWADYLDYTASIHRRLALYERAILAAAERNGLAGDEFLANLPAGELLMIEDLAAPIVCDLQFVGPIRDARIGDDGRLALRLPSARRFATSPAGLNVEQAVALLNEQLDDDADDLTVEQLKDGDDGLTVEQLERKIALGMRWLADGPPPGIR